MSSMYEEVSIASLSSGAVVEMVDAAIAKVVENIADLNTDAKATRSITLKITIKPDAERVLLATAIVCKTTMAPDRGIATVLHCARNERNEHAAFEFTPVQEALPLVDGGVVTSIRGGK
jgi:hypothetical protein